METFQRPTIKLGQPKPAQIELSQFGNTPPFSPAEMAFLRRPLPFGGGGPLGGGSFGGGFGIGNVGNPFPLPRDLWELEVHHR